MTSIVVVIIAAMVGLSCGSDSARSARDGATDESAARDAGDPGDGDVVGDAVRDVVADVVADVVEDGPPRPNFIFVTSQRHFLRFPTLDAADRKCDDAARAAGLPGRYRAWLSTSETYAKDRLNGARGWVRPDGRPFTDTLEDLFAGRIFYPPLLDEFGVQVLSGVDDFVATGTSATGENIPGRNCNDWKNDRGGMTIAAGITDSTSRLWTRFQDFDCASAMRLYCFGVDQHVVVAPTPVPGKRAFVSDAIFSDFGGIAAADALCAREAAEAQIAGTFLALLPAGGSSAASRFSSSVDATWLRLDGVPINAPGESLFAGSPLLTPLNVTSRGTYLWDDPGGGLVQAVFTGAPTPNFVAPLSMTCQDWTQLTYDVEAPTGTTTRVGDWWYPGMSRACRKDSARIYCLER